MLNINFSENGVAELIKNYPSLVITIPPMGSMSILSMDCGPRVEVTISETAWIRSEGVRKRRGWLQCVGRVPLLLVCWLVALFCLFLFWIGCSSP